MRSVHFRVSDGMYILIQHGAEDVGASVAHTHGTYPHDSDGRLVARDRGNVHFRILFDTEGDAIPGGIFIEELGADVHGPHPGFDDFCGLITPLIGP